MFDYFAKYYNERFPGDPRVTDWFLMSSPIPTILISLCYIIIVKKIGPKLMQNQKPFQLKNTIIAYNAFQVILSVYLAYENGLILATGFHLFKCNNADYSLNPNSLRILSAHYLYFLSKYLEFLDTIFFILRKKDNQISFLHVYHHSSTPIFDWFVMKNFAVSSYSAGPALNALVHVLMYSYYLFAAFGPEFQKYLWWKKYITTVQLVQFATGFAHLVFLLFSSDCNIPKSFTLFYLGLASILYILFYNFYKENYKEKMSEDIKSSHKL